jgi:ribonuclease HI
MNNVITIYTDGGAHNNPGPAGCAAILRYNEHIKELWCFFEHATNNQMELLAIIMALDSLKKDNLNIQVITDSSYVKDGITKWIFAWQKNNWRGSSNKQVKNLALWQYLLALTKKHHIEWLWVKGHSGDLYNEKADELVQKAIADKLPILGQYNHLLT